MVNPMGIPLDIKTLCVPDHVMMHGGAVGQIPLAEKVADIRSVKSDAEFDRTVGIGPGRVMNPVVSNDSARLTGPTDLNLPPIGLEMTAIVNPVQLDKISFPPFISF